MTTRADFIVTVADFLGISEAGQELSAEDSNKIGRYINAACNELRGKGNILIDPTSEVPDEVEISLGQYCAYVASSAYNMNPQVLQAKFDGKTRSMLEGDINAALSGKASYSILPIQSF